MEAYVASLKSVPLAAGFEEVFYPGEPEARSDARLRSEGLDLLPDTRADLARIATESCVPLPF